MLDLSRLAILLSDGSTSRRSHLRSLECDFSRRPSLDQLQIIKSRRFALSFVTFGLCFFEPDPRPSSALGVNEHDPRGFKGAADHLIIDPGELGLAARVQHGGWW